MKLPKIVTAKTFGVPNWIIGAGVFAYWYFFVQDIVNPGNVNATGGLNATSGPGGNTPGWYTLQGHHHCGVDAQGNFAAGCLCTDPKKCIGHAGTDAAYCAAHQSECWPTNKPNWCAYWYASDQQYCNLCNGPWKYTGPAGSGAKPCP